MPMIEFRYNPEKISKFKAEGICPDLEGALRSALREARPIYEGCSVFLEGDPFNVRHNQPDLRIYVFYHPSWNFSEGELAQLPKAMGRFLMPSLSAFGLADVDVMIRFYRRDGHASFSFNV